MQTLLQVQYWLSHLSGLFFAQYMKIKVHFFDGLVSVGNEKSEQIAMSWNRPHVIRYTVYTYLYLC